MVQSKILGDNNNYLLKSVPQWSLNKCTKWRMHSDKMKYAVFYNLNTRMYKVIDIIN